VTHPVEIKWVELSESEQDAAFKEFDMRMREQLLCAFCITRPVDSPACRLGRPVPDAELMANGCSLEKAQAEITRERKGEGGDDA
jgi:hypothetical protein